MNRRTITIAIPQKDETLHMVMLDRMIVEMKKTKEEYGRGAEECILSGEFTEQEMMDLKEMKGIRLITKLKKAEENCYLCEFSI